MMHNHHPSHWIAVALALGFALLTVGEAGGQSTNSRALFEGRPALAGAQAGLGAQAGPPQGGIGVQSSDAAQMNLRRPRSVEERRDMPQGRTDEAPPALAQVDEERILPPKLEPDTTPAQARTRARQAR